MSQQPHTPPCTVLTEATGQPRYYPPDPDRVRGHPVEPSPPMSMDGAAAALFAVGRLRTGRQPPETPPVVPVVPTASFLDVPPGAVPAENWLAVSGPEMPKKKEEGGTDGQ